MACGSSPAVPEDAIAQARRMLEENGVAGRRIHQKIVTCTSIADTILRMAREGEYGVLATGRTGRGESRTLHLLGSVSMNLLKHLESATLWICH